MKTLIVMGLLLASLAASGCASGSAPMAGARTVVASPVVPAGMSAIEGYVVDESLEPLVGAHVAIRGLDLVLRADEDGHYHSGPILPGSYRVRAAYPGHGEDEIGAPAVVGEVALAVFVLRSVPVPDLYEVRQLQKGFVACAIALGPSTGLGFSEIGAEHDLECGAPRAGSGTAGMGPVQGVQDRSVRRWVLDEPQAIWLSGMLVTRWSAGHELSRSLLADFGVDGCVDEERRFDRTLGPSPIRQSASEDRVRAVLVRADGTTCATPEERCDQESCVLSSRVRPAPRALGQPWVRFGAAVQQAFEQELTASFRVESAS